LYLVPFRLKYVPQYPVHNYPQPIFLPHCQRTSFATIRI
jgi:hypothetical protein